MYPVPPDVMFAPAGLKWNPPETLVEHVVRQKSALFKDNDMFIYTMYIIYA